MIVYCRPIRSHLYTLCESKLLENHTLHSGTYLYEPYLAVPPPPPRPCNHREIVVALSILFSKGPFLIPCVHCFRRQLFSIASYFFFFYNIILGFFAALIRILKGLLLGIIFMARIDRTCLMQGYETWDKGS